MTTSTAYLLDSHVLLWWWFAPQRLPKGVLALLSDAETPIVVSSASVWELSIKHHLGKLPELQPAITDLPALLRADGFQIPFDRMLHSRFATCGLLLPLA